METEDEMFESYERTAREKRQVLAQSRQAVADAKAAVRRSRVAVEECWLNLQRCHPADGAAETFASRCSL